MKLFIYLKKTLITTGLVVIHSFAFSQVTVSLLAGNSSGFSNGTGASARFYFPSEIAKDASGNYYVADEYNHRIRKVTPDGVVTTIAGSVAGSTDGTTSSALFSYPQGIAVDSSGNIFVADTGNNSIRRISTTNEVTTLAVGTATSNPEAQFTSPKSITIDKSNNIYFVEGTNKLKKITVDGTVTTVAGSTYGDANGSGSVAKFAIPSGLTTDSDGNIYLADTGNHKIKKITPAGVVTTLCGSVQGFEDGPTSNAKFSLPYDLTIDNLGNLYVADRGNHKIRKISTTGQVSTVAGSSQGYQEGDGVTAKFSYPKDLVIDSFGNLIVSDSDNNRIRKISFGTMSVTDINKSTIDIYPNPTSDYVKIKIDKISTNANYVINSLEGKLVKQGNIFNSETEIDLRNFTKGVYLIAIKNGKESNTYKVIKN